MRPLKPGQSSVGTLKGYGFTTHAVQITAKKIPHHVGDYTWTNWIIDGVQYGRVGKKPSAAWKIGRFVIQIADQEGASL